MRPEADTGYIEESLPAFFTEAEEHLEQFEQLLLRLESAPDDRELLDALFRSAHTTKGSAGIFGLDAIVAFTHHMETLLDRLRAGSQRFDASLGTLLLECGDALRELVAAVRRPPADATSAAARRDALVDRLRTAYGDAAAPAHTVAGADSSFASTPAEGEIQLSCWSIHAAFGPDTFRNGMDPLTIVTYLGAQGDLVAAMDASRIPSLDEIDAEACYLTIEGTLRTAVSRDQIEAAFSFVREDVALVIESTDVATASSQRPRTGESAATTDAEADIKGDTRVSRPAGSSSDGQTVSQERAPRPVPDDNRYIRVQADRLDRVINLLGELVIASAGATLQAHQSRIGGLVEATQQIATLVEEIRGGTLQLRMVPIGDTLARFRRVVRDTAAELGKDIALDIKGGEAELDKSVVERIADPLLHLVRNALDHGLERPEERVVAGKPAQGRLTLSACHEAGSILITIADDGRGIDRDKVLARAWERGLVPVGVTPADPDILNLIFEPGFSTADKVTNLSGRGVGMDVVRRNVEALRGSVNLASVPGQGSRIEIRLPLTLAIIDGFLVGVGASKFIFPLDAVVEVVECRSDSDGPDRNGRRLVDLRGQPLPVVSLRRLYGIGGPAPERGSIVVVRTTDRRFGVEVDLLLGQHQTVIKPLGRMFRSLRGMAGSSILGNGEVALIFDMNSLCQLAEQAPMPAAATAQAVP